MNYHSLIQKESDLKIISNVKDLKQFTSLLISIGIDKLAMDISIFYSEVILLI